MELYFNAAYPSGWALGLSILYLSEKIPVVVLTTLEENFISPIQNLAEKFTTDIYKTRLSNHDPRDVIWIEHRPPFASLDDEDEFDQIFFEWSGKKRLFGRWEGAYSSPKWGSPSRDVLDLIAGRLELHSKRAAWSPFKIKQKLDEGELKRVVKIGGCSVMLTEREIDSLNSARDFLKGQMVSLGERYKHIVSIPTDVLRFSGSGWDSIVWYQDRNTIGIKHQAVYWECSVDEFFGDIGES